MLAPSDLAELICETLKASGRVEPSHDAFALAFDLGLAARPRTRRGAVLLTAEHAIDFDASAPPELRQRLVAREIARWALRQWHMEEVDASVACVAIGLVASVTMLRAMRKVLESDTLTVWASCAVENQV